MVHYQASSFRDGRTNPTMSRFFSHSQSVRQESHEDKGSITELGYHRLDTEAWKANHVRRLHTASNLQSFTVVAACYVSTCDPWRSTGSSSHRLINYDCKRSGEVDAKAQKLTRNVPDANDANPLNHQCEPGVSTNRSHSEICRRRVKAYPHLATRMNVCVIREGNGSSMHRVKLKQRSAEKTVNHHLFRNVSVTTSHRHHAKVGSDDAALSHISRSRSTSKESSTNSALAAHYKQRKIDSQALERKSYLPYRTRLLGC
ncbi:hypothetical protein KP509_39G059800 [Ceratopteris richardii]|uniref:Uncharacterized protein n=1 Tax=Ceratopteris richardii TaxID=49495 RepID=A0A8T2Q1W8_CERRI|nr:hypothetical protein KP509_39G059800 [Ceratopteris richardii]